MHGADTLALLPTGGGKSLCFQVPGLCMDGICLVISPLLALMNDQVVNLRKKGIKANAVNSAMSAREIDRVLDNCVYGDEKFLYVSPERLQNEMFLERFRKMKIGLIAVDEAHCISQWGYDFRPDYLKIVDLRALKPEVPILALTASATPAVVQDIQQKLNFRKELVLGSSFARANLSYNVSLQEDKENKILEICRKMKGSGIVYCSSRLRTRELASLLSKRGVPALAYNAGMSNIEREHAFRRWMNNEVRLMCATNAFGMGIDKPDVRFVIHADVPANPESYFQEAGRAGRDGQKAYAVLLYNDADPEKLFKQIDQRYPSKEFIRKVYKCIGNFLQLAPGAGLEIAYPFPLTEFVRNFSLNYTETIYALQLLELGGYVRVSDIAFLPSRIVFRMRKQDLYSYQVANPSLDGFIKIILRMYGGVFEQFTNIRESDMAKNARMTIPEVVEKLKMLKHQQVLDYVQQTDIPVITFLTGRMHEDSLIIAPDIYEIRLKRDIERAEAIRKYLTHQRCRSIQLLEYFGEKHTSPCGICDVCREKSKQGLTPVEYEEMSNAVMDIVMNQSVTMEELPAALPKFSAEHLIEFTRWKIDQGELELDDKLFLNVPGLENE